MDAVVQALQEALGADSVRVDPDVTASYSRDMMPLAPVGQPLAVVFPEDVEQVQAVVRICGRAGVPIVPRGAGSGLSGAANAIDGCVMLVTTRMNAILEIDQDNRLAVVEPGVVNLDLRDAVEKHGLFYPPDPSSYDWCSIGGNLSTNAGGLCCVKYGVTGDYVLGLTVVTGTGEVVRLGRRTAKGVAGYDLTSLLVGSEGTLGIITGVTVKLRPKRPAERTIVGYFDSVERAGEAAAAVFAAGVTPSALELVDRHCLAAVDAWKNMGLSVDAQVLLLARTDAPGESGAAEAALIHAAFVQAQATWAAVSTDAQEAESLFEARRLAYPALERLGPLLTEDVCVPRAKVAEMLRSIEAIAARHETLIANIAHIGDGNLHPLLMTRPGDEPGRLRAQAAFADIIEEALRLGGTVTGEHGVGLLKMAGLAQELSAPVVEMHRAIKAALDPHGILNPGKVISSRT
jgi:glycolate oxidase